MSTRFKVLAGVLGLFIVGVAATGVYFSDRAAIGADELAPTRNVPEFLLSPSELVIKEGSVKTLIVALNNGAGVKLVRFRLLYDPAVIAIEKVVAAPAVSSPVVTIDNDKGELSFQGQMIVVNDSLAAIALLRVKAKAVGTTNVSFNNESPTPLVVRDAASIVPLTQAATVTVE